MFLALDTLPAFSFSHDRHFQPGEKHVTRCCRDDVIVFLFSGVLRFRENGRDVEVQPGEYYIQQRELFQQGLVPSDSPSYYYIHFHGGWSHDAGIRIHGIYPPETRQLLEQLDALCVSNASALEKHAVFFRLLSALPFSQPPIPHSPLAEEIRTRLQASLQTGVTLTELSDRLHFSPNYLIRIFRDAYGKTPMEYLNQLRVEKAEQLLRYSDLSIGAIAAECGFGSYVNLYKTFRKMRGCAPGETRP